MKTEEVVKIKPESDISVDVKEKENRFICTCKGIDVAKIRNKKYKLIDAAVMLDLDKKTDATTLVIRDGRKRYAMSLKLLELIEENARKTIKAKKDKEQK